VAVTPCALAALAGTLVLFALPRAPPPVFVLAIGIAAGLFCARWAPRALAAIASATVACLWAALLARHELAQRWPAQSAQARAVIVATIDSIPVADELGWRVDASVRTRDTGSIGRMRITWPFRTQRPHAGETWQLLVDAAPACSRSNPRGPDAERQLFRERLHAFGRVVDSRLNRRLAGGARPLARLRERIAARIEAGVSDRDAAALIAALAVGHTGGLSREQWRVFNATGTTHLVAISGLHVTLFAVLAIAVGRVMWRVLPPMSNIPRDTFAAVLGLSAATAYAFLAGFSVPT
jgi:competence protein ComEC